MKICIGCNKTLSDDMFHKNRNQCKQCRSKYSQTYREENKEILKEKKKEYWGKIGQEERWRRVRKTVQQAPNNFLVDLASRCRKQSNKKAMSQNGGNYAPIDQCDFDAEYLKELYKNQNGKCTLTGLDMVHQYGKLNTISVDRIDSGKGYLKGNVQLVCQGVNRMKNTHTQQEVLEFIEMIKNIR